MDRSARLTRQSVSLASALLLLAGYGAFLVHRTVDSVGGSDVYSYVSSGRALAQGRVLRKVAALEELGLPSELDRLFIPLGAAPGREPGTMVSVVPIGVPFHMAAAGKLAGVERGPFLVSPLAAVVTLVLLFLLGRTAP